MRKVGGRVVFSKYTSLFISMKGKGPSSMLLQNVGMVCCLESWLVICYHLCVIQPRTGYIPCYLSECYESSVSHCTQFVWYICRIRRWQEVSCKFRPQFRNTWEVLENTWETNAYCVYIRQVWFTNCVTHIVEWDWIVWTGTFLVCMM
jgi:hypothetical protein